jgi:hypothetical protein
VAIFENFINTTINKYCGVEKMQMKRILGILLALCFLMSVTAAAVSADPVMKIGDDKKTGDKKIGDDKKMGDDKKTGDDKKREDDKKRNDEKFKHKHFFKGHWETKLVKTFIGFKHGKPVYVYKLVKVFVPAKWMYY